MTDSPKDSRVLVISSDLLDKLQVQEAKTYAQGVKLARDLSFAHQGDYVVVRVRKTIYFKESLKKKRQPLHSKPWDKLNLNGSFTFGINYISAQRACKYASKRLYPKRFKAYTTDKTDSEGRFLIKVTRIY